ncbi:MAG: hypothetical protein ABF497_04820, partial [Sporolactobacillus sp.]
SIFCLRLNFRLVRLKVRQFELNLSPSVELFHRSVELFTNSVELFHSSVELSLCSVESSAV